MAQGPPHAAVPRNPAIPALLRPDLAFALTVLLDEVLGEHGVDVLARGNTVTLRGHVHAPLDRLTAEDLVYSFQEIERCCNFLTVEDPEPSLATTESSCA